MRWPHRPDDGGPRWARRAEFGRGQARGAPRGLTWRELAGTFSGPDGGSAADGAPSGITPVVQFCSAQLSTSSEKVPTN